MKNLNDLRADFFSLLSVGSRLCVWIVPIVPKQLSKLSPKSLCPEFGSLRAPSFNFKQEAGFERFTEVLCKLHSVGVALKLQTHDLWTSNCTCHGCRMRKSGIKLWLDDLIERYNQLWACPGGWLMIVLMRFKGIILQWLCRWAQQVHEHAWTSGDYPQPLLAMWCTSLSLNHSTREIIAADCWPPELSVRSRIRISPGFLTEPGPCHCIGPENHGCAQQEVEHPIATSGESNTWHFGSAGTLWKLAGRLTHIVIQNVLVGLEA